MIRFPRLHERILGVITKLLRQRIDPTKEMVKDLIKLQLAYINTKHPDFQDAYLAGQKRLKGRKGKRKNKMEDSGDSGTGNVLPSSEDQESDSDSGEESQQSDEVRHRCFGHLGTELSNGFHFISAWKAQVEHQGEERLQGY